MTGHFFTPAMQRWMGGYEPQLPRLMCDAKVSEQRADAARGGKRFGSPRGSIIGLSAKADALIAAMESRR
jgi:hypothetical protein